MSELDLDRTMTQLDKSNVLQNLRDFPDQVMRAWELSEKVPVPPAFLKSKDIVIVGMGGSGIGGGLIAELTQLSCPIPVRAHRDTTALKAINSNTLVIACSYSGETEETLRVFEHAAKLGAKLVTIGTDHTLASLGRKYRSTPFIVDYGASTRMAFGYMFTPLVYIFYKLGWLQTTPDEIVETVSLMRALDGTLHPGIPTYKNQAKQLAQRMQDKLVVILGSGPMSEVARRMSQDISENAKQFAASFAIPEFQHNTLSGFDHPKTLKEQVRVILLQSKYTNERNRLRENLISQVLQRKKIPLETVFMHPSVGALSEVCLTIFFSGYASYYLAHLNQTDPGEVPLQSKVKEELQGEG